MLEGAFITWNLTRGAIEQKSCEYEHHQHEPCTMVSVAPPVDAADTLDHPAGPVCFSSKLSSFEFRTKRFMLFLPVRGLKCVATSDRQHNAGEFSRFQEYPIRSCLGMSTTRRYAFVIVCLQTTNVLPFRSSSSSCNTTHSKHATVRQRNSPHKPKLTYKTDQNVFPRHIHEAKGGCQPDWLDHRASLRKFTCLMHNELYLTVKQDHEVAKALKQESEGLKAQIKHLQAELAACKSISGLTQR
jgi:hypothetical protein